MHSIPHTSRKETIMKNLVSCLVVALFSVILSGCAVETPVGVSASYSVYSNYEDKIPGVYGLYVDASEMKKDVETRGFTCGPWYYPVDARDAFKQSVYRTFENLVEELKGVDVPVFNNLRSQGLDGIIKIDVVNFEADTSARPDFLVTVRESSAEITASIEVTGYEGVLLGSNVDGSGNDSITGISCEGGSDTVGKSVETAMKKVIERLGERLANSVKVREAAPKN